MVEFIAADYSQNHYYCGRFTRRQVQLHRRGVLRKEKGSRVQARDLNREAHHPRSATYSMRGGGLRWSLPDR